MNDNADSQKKSDEEVNKAKNTMDKDTPSSTETPSRKAADQEEPRPYRPDENVDNQKSEKSRKEPGHNSSIKEAPFPGAQVAKDKTAHKENIDEKSDKADPKASG